MLLSPTREEADMVGAVAAGAGDGVPTKGAWHRGWKVHCR